MQITDPAHARALIDALTLYDEILTDAYNDTATMDGRALLTRIRRVEDLLDDMPTDLPFSVQGADEMIIIAALNAQSPLSSASW